MPLGQPLCGLTASIRSESGQEINEDGQTSELLLTGEGRATVYLGYPALSLAAFGTTSSFSYCSGDLVRWRQDERGKRILTFVGRRTLTPGACSHPFPLAELEAILAQHPALQEVAFVPAGSLDRPQLAVFLVPQPTIRTQVDAFQEVLQEELGRRLSRYLPQLHLPVQVFLRERLPLSAAGRIDRERLRATVLSGASADTLLASATPALVEVSHAL